MARLVFRSHSIPLKHLALLVPLMGMADVQAEPAADALADPSWSLLGRNYFLHNDFRSDSSSGQNYRQEWAQGFIGEFRSGYTPGAIGLGTDVHGFLGIKLDGGRGHAGTGLLPRGDDGRSADDFSSAGASLKLRMGRSQLRYGEMTVETPVFDTGDKRLQPEYTTGFLLDSAEVEDLRIQAGHFTSFKNQDSSSGHGDFSGYGATTSGSSISLAGVDFAPPGRFSGALYGAQLDDTWRQGYLNLRLQQSPLLLDANLYRTRDQGAANAGAIDTLAYSLSVKYLAGAQAVTLAYQHIHGDTPFDFVGGDSIYLANSVKYADFNGPNERSWQVRYDLDMAMLGIPGLTFMTRYVSGRDIDGTSAPAGGAYNPFDPVIGRFVPQQGRDGKHWERDIDLHYQVMSGVAKDLSIKLSHVSHRGNSAQAGDDIDRLYLILEYPLKGWL